MGRVTHARKRQPNGKGDLRTMVLGSFGPQWVGLVEWRSTA